MPTERKVRQVAELEDRLQRAVITIGLDYSGLTVSQMRALRLMLREQDPGTELRVIKNTLFKRAAESTGHTQAVSVANGVTALVFGYEEEVGPPKAISRFLRERRLEIPIHGGYTGGAILSPADVADLATVPSRMELMSRVAGGINSPIRGIAGGLHNIIREIAAVIDARATQLEAMGGAAAVSAGAAASASESPDPSSEASAPGESVDTAEANETSS